MTNLENALLIILFCILCAITAAFLIAVINALRIKGTYKTPKEFRLGIDDINSQIHASHLARIIQIPSVSVRGSNDFSQIKKMHKTLEELYPNIHNKLEKIDIDGALLFKWRGKSTKSNPILLMSHMDVVEATGNWKFSPFSGTIHDGKIWGRGAVDTKGALCAILEAVEHLVSIDFVPSCDVYIASSNNEEITGDGAVKTVEYLYKQGIRFDLVMDEGGAVMCGTMGIKEPSAMVGIVEKGRANIQFIAHSTGGHASIPFNNNPFAKLSRVIDKIDKNPPFKRKLTTPVKNMYKAMCPYLSFKYRLVLGNLWLFGWILPFVCSKMGGQAAALVQSTCVFTMAEGSSGANVIPETATATANVRFILHENEEKTLAKLQKIADKNNVEMLKISGYDICPSADTNTYAYKQVIRQIKDTFGDIPIVPYVMLAGTDARHYTKICDCVLRFVPLIFSEEQQKSAHAIDENLDVSSLARGVTFYIDFIKNYNK